MTPTRQEPRNADLVVVNAQVTTQTDDRATAFAVVGGTFAAVGSDEEVTRWVAPSTTLVDARGRRVVPGLDDSHMHTVRGGLMYNLELRWDGVPSLAAGLAMIREQAARTPRGQWVRVMGGWSPHQFEERRMPTPAELTEAAPDTPVLVLFGYSEVVLNRAGVDALDLTSQDDTDAYRLVPGGARVFGNVAVYATIGRLPNLEGLDDRVNSTQHFFRELNRFGLTSTVDAGESATTYPDDYEAVARLAAAPGFPLRLSTFLFAQEPGTEQRFWDETAARAPLARDQGAREGGYVLAGAGEVLAWAAHDYENFLAERPELSDDAVAQFRAVTRMVAGHQWPIRVHATYDETIGTFLDVFEEVFAEVGYTGRWALDHAETISAANVDRVRALGGGVAVQNRLSFSGEHFLERYGREAADAVQPLRMLVDKGVPVGAGTDATRPAGYNPWISLHWMTTGRTVGGTQVAAPRTRLTRAEALFLYTVGSAWFSHEESAKGRIAPGQLADFAVLSDDYFAVDDDAVPHIESVLTVVGGDVVHAAEPFADLAPAPLPEPSPAWSPVAVFGGAHRRRRLDATP